MAINTWHKFYLYLDYILGLYSTNLGPVYPRLGTVYDPRIHFSVYSGVFRIFACNLKLPNEILVLNKKRVSRNTGIHFF